MSDGRFVTATGANDTGREMLALLFGQERVEEHKQHITSEANRLVSEYRQMQEEALVELVESCRVVTKEEAKSLDEDPDTGHHEASKPRATTSIRRNLRPKG